MSLVSNVRDARAFLQSYGILRTNRPRCDITLCQREMTEVQCSALKDEVIYRCPSHKSRKVSIRKDSFLSGHNITLQDFVVITYLWAYEISVTAAVDMSGLSKPSVIQWYSYLRDSCSHKLVTNPIHIGGVGEVVEIDESLVARRKYNRGHHVPEKWVFGGINPNTRIGFLKFVDDRSAATLLPLIERYILPGTLIRSDQWAAYNGITSINVTPPYIHQTVNHQLHFVDPITGCTTNHIEAMWKNAKRKLKAMQGVHTTMLPAHLDEAMWRMRYAPTHGEAFERVLSDIGDWYVV